MKLLTVAVLMSFILPLHAEERVLNLYSWPDYVGEKTIKAFEAETGIRVNYDTFDSNDVLESKLLTGRAGYDLVFPSTAMAGRVISAKALQVSGLQQMKGVGNLDQGIVSKVAAADPGNQYVVPYTWGTIGLAVNRQAVEKRIPNAPFDSLDLLFKPEYASKLKDCGISVIDTPQEVISIALNYLGKSPYSSDPADLKQVQVLLGKLQPNLHNIGLGTQSTDLANGDICLALTYNGDANTARTQAEAAHKPFDVAYHIPREGTLMWVDTMAIPADAPHPAEAKAFVEFMLRPGSMAELTNSLYFANANQASTAMVDKDIVNDPNIYPSEDVRAHLFGEQSLPAKVMRERMRAWTTFRTRQ
ncbi:MAG: extracellular solute-binding protein [Pseudomonas sp.]